MRERWAALDNGHRAAADLVKLLGSEPSDENNRKLIHGVATVRRLCVGIDGLVDGYRHFGAQVEGVEARAFEEVAEQLSTVVTDLREALDTLDTLLDKAVAFSIAARRQEKPYPTLAKHGDEADWDQVVRKIVESMVTK